MKKCFFLLSLALGSLTLNSQTHTHEHGGHDLSNPLQCGTDHVMNKLYADNPSIAESDAINQANFQAEYEDFLTTWSPDERSTYTVPVVVHIVHLGGPENISNEQVFDGIEKLNDDFNMTNSDLGSTIPEFAGITGNCNIEFKLATKNNAGQCHPGITRTYSNTTYDTGLSGGLSHPIVNAVRDEHGTWPQNKYMNIFVCISPTGDAAGYTYRPGNWYPAGGMIGGIVIRHDYFGSIGTSNIAYRHTLSHEAGHWLNLAHPWGGTNSPALASNCGTDDGVADTPNTIGWNNCSNVYGETCGSLDNVQNIMDYSYCSTMFTEGQAARVQASLTGTTAQRYKLFTASNLIATGTNGPGDLCEAKFSSDSRVVCEGNSVSFSDQSYHTVTGRSWTFEGGSPSSSTSANPTITYNTPGAYTVTLTVSNGADSETETITNYIVVLPENGASIPYKESFETLPGLPDNNRFTLENENGAQWLITTSASSHGSKSATLPNYYEGLNSKDVLVSGTIDLSGVSSTDDIVFNFKYAYRKKEASNDEWIRFYISKDCGETWALRKNINGSSLSTEISATPYVPLDDQWKQVDITNIYSDYFVRNFMYKIEFRGNGGNNVYIDDINMYAASTAGLEDELPTDFEASVYPNPLGNTMNIQLSGNAGDNYTVSLYSPIGQKIATLYSGALPSQQKTIEWSSADLSKGMYLLRIESQNQVKTIRLVKE